MLTEHRHQRLGDAEHALGGIADRIGACDIGGRGPCGGRNRRATRCLDDRHATALVPHLGDQLDAAGPALAAPVSRRMPMTCWPAVTRLSTVTGVPDAPCTPATLSRTMARAVAGATGNGPDGGAPSSAAALTPLSAATCSCPTTASMASRPGTVTVATAVSSRPWRITESPPPPERARTRPLGLRTVRHRR